MAGIEERIKRIKCDPLHMELVALHLKELKSTHPELNGQVSEGYALNDWVEKNFDVNFDRQKAFVVLGNSYCLQAFYKEVRQIPGNV